jgi:hypothetical protein
MVMEGSIFSILPSLILIFLGLPAMVPKFEGKLQVVWEKSVWIWGFLKNCSRVGVSLLDFLFTTPVIQLPILIVVGSGAINYLVQLGIKSFIEY